MRKIQGFTASILLATLISMGLPGHSVRAATSRGISQKLSADLVRELQGTARDERVKLIVQFKRASTTTLASLVMNVAGKVTRRLDALNIRGAAGSRSGAYQQTAGQIFSI